MLLFHRLATSFECGFKTNKNDPSSRLLWQRCILSVKTPGCENCDCDSWAFLSVPSRLGDWVWSGFRTLLCLHIHLKPDCYRWQVPTETGTPCSIPLDYSDIVVTFSACILWKDCDVRRIIYDCWSALTWAVHRKSDLCSVKWRKASIHEVQVINYFLEVPWSASDGFLLISSYFLQWVLKGCTRYTSSNTVLWASFFSFFPFFSTPKLWDKQNNPRCSFSLW